MESPCIKQLIRLKLVAYVIQRLSSKINSSIILHHTPNIIIYTISRLYSNMQKISQANQHLIHFLPFYADLYQLVLSQIKHSRQTFNQLYNISTDRVLKAKKSSDRFTQQAIWLFSQSAEQLLQIMESKLKIINDQSTDLNKKPRLLKVVSQLKQQYFLKPLDATIKLPQKTFNWIKSLPTNHILPLYFTLKAAIIVSREFMMEVLAQRLGHLKMTYEESKDAVTMIFSGQLDQTKILEKLSKNFNDFKQITINFAKKGMEIKVSKIQLRQNFLALLDKIVETVRQVSEKGSEEWDSAKLKTMTLYNQMLSRIKQKQVLIKTEYYKKPTTELKQEVAALTDQ